MMKSIIANQILRSIITVELNHSTLNTLEISVSELEKIKKAKKMPIHQTI